VDEELSPAECRVAELLPTHLYTWQIANELCISRATVRTHVGNIYRKVGASCRDEAVRALNAR
jgi:LuxR family transcriptional regulator, maltose regulon positive regulatory protein